MAYTFAIPRTRSVQYETIFQLTKQENIDAMKIASTKREAVVTAANQAQSGQHEDVLVSALQAYIPYVIALSQQVEKSTVVLMHKSLDFRWTSSLLTPPRAHERDADRHFTVYHLFPEENAQCHVTMAITMYRWAGRLHRDLDRLRDIPAHTRPESVTSSSSATTRAEKRKEVVAILRQTAGIFQYLATELIPSYHEKAPSRPPDTTACCCDAMKWMCLALAQEITLDTAMETRTSAALCAKLAYGIAEKYGSIKKSLVTGMGTAYQNLDFNWNAYLHAKTEQYEALCRKYLAYAAQDASDYGTSVAYLAISSRILQSITLPVSHELANPCLSQIQKEIAMDRQLTDEEHKSALNDNSKIYFGLVPSSSSLPAPTSTFMCTPIEYIPPPPVNMAFFDFVTPTTTSTSTPDATVTSTPSEPTLSNPSSSNHGMMIG